MKSADNSFDKSLRGWPSLAIATVPCEKLKILRGPFLASAGLCCTNRLRDSSRESSVVAGMHEQTDTHDLQNQELASLQ
jgi:hypothetical protein